MKRAGFSVIELTLVASIVAAIPIGVYQGVQRGKQSQCINNLKQIGQALQMFSMDHGTLPDAKFFPSSAVDSKGINSLLSGSGTTPEIFFCPSIPEDLNKRGTNYLWNNEFNGRSLDTVGAKAWLMTEMTAVTPRIPSPHTAGYGILYGDGHADVGPRVAFQEVAAPPKPVETTKVEETPAPAAPVEKRLARIEIKPPAGIKTGTKVSLTAEMFDQQGGLWNQAGGSLNIESSDQKAVLPKSIALTAGLGPRVSFGVTFMTPGDQWIAVKDPGSGTTGRAVVRVAEERVGALVFDPVPAAVKAGEPVRVKITAQAATGEKIPYNDKGWLGDEGGRLSFAEILFKDGVWSGEVTFPVPAKDDRLIVLSGGRTVAGGVFQVTAGPCVKLAVAAPDEVTAGAKFECVITALDAGGNPCADYRGEIKLEAADARKVVPGQLAFTADGNGVCRFPLVFCSAGKLKFRVSSGTLAGEKEVYVNAGPLDHFVLDKIPGQVAGKPFRILIKAEDAWGNKVKGFSLQQSSGAFTYEQKDYSSGMWMERISITKAGREQFLTADDGCGHTGKSNLFDVAAADPETLAAEGCPVTAVAGVPVALRFSARDHYGNVIEGYAPDLETLCTDQAVKLELAEQAAGKISVTFTTPGLQSLDIKDRKIQALRFQRSILVVPQAVPGPASR